MKWWVIGALLGVLIALVAKIGFWALFGTAALLLVMASFVDWSGQGDGRQGCNRHTNCDH